MGWWGFRGVDGIVTVTVTSPHRHSYASSPGAEKEARAGCGVASRQVASGPIDVVVVAVWVAKQASGGDSVAGEGAEWGSCWIIRLVYARIHGIVAIKRFACV